MFASHLSTSANHVPSFSYIHLGYRGLRMERPGEEKSKAKIGPE